MKTGSSPAARALRRAQAASRYARQTGCGIGEASSLLAERGAASARGARDAYNGRAYYSWSAGDPHTGGAYSYLKTGQHTAFNGIQGRRSGNPHFAGEHTLVNFQGCMEGALRSGDRRAGTRLTRPPG